jgi:hypothetical protein
MWEPGCENWIWKLSIIIYARITLFENRVNVENLKILVTWSVLTSKKKYIKEPIRFS